MIRKIQSPGIFVCKGTLLFFVTLLALPPRCGNPAEKPTVVIQSNCTKTAAARKSNGLNIFTCVAAAEVPSDQDELAIIRVVTKAARSEKINGIMSQLLISTREGSSTFCTLVAKWDRHVRKQDIGFSSLLETMNGKKRPPPPENQADRGDLFKAIMSSEFLSVPVARGVTRCFNLHYMESISAIGERIQDDFGFLFLNAIEGKKKLSPAVFAVGREILAHQGFKPDHLERRERYLKYAVAAESMTKPPDE